MFRKIEVWILYLAFVLSIIFAISFGILVRQELVGHQKLGIISKFALTLAEMPHNLKTFILNNLTSGDYIFRIKNAKYRNKPRFRKFISTDRNKLLLLSRYSSNYHRNVVEIIDLNDFSVLHTFLPDINQINRMTDPNRTEFKKLLIDKRPERYFFWNPLISSNGDLIFQSDSPLVKIDFCGNLLWVNDEDAFHHSINVDHEGNYWVPSRMFPFSIDKELIGKNLYDYNDDAITKISSNGRILYQKSVTEILINNGYKSLLFSQQDYQWDKIHLNDIQPTLNNGPYWNRGDIFISLRNLSMIIHYRPKLDKIMDIITGSFFNQHDVDIINEKEISIFNNNTFLTRSGKRVLTNNEVLIYNFESKKFYKKFAKSIAFNNVKTIEHGLNEIMKDGSMLVDERDEGRILMFNNNGDLEWEYVNRGKNGMLYYVWWPRIVDDKEIVINLRKKIKKKSCLN